MSVAEDATSCRLGLGNAGTEAIPSKARYGVIYSSEAPAHGDALARNETRTLAQSESHGDSLLLTETRRPAQTISHADVAARTLARTLAQGTAHADAVAKNEMRVGTNAVAHADGSLVINTLLDSSGNGNTLTEVGTAGTATNPSVAGTAFDLSRNQASTGQGVDTGITSRPTAFTIRGWIKPSNVNSTFQIVAGMDQAGSLQSWKVDLSNTNEIWFELHDGSGNHKINGGSVSTGTVYHFEAAYDGSTAYFFINGVSKGTFALTLTASTKNLRLGCETLSGGTVNTFFGDMDEFEWSNVVRHTSGFTVPTTPYVADANTVGLWHFGTLASGATRQLARRQAEAESHLDAVPSRALARPKTESSATTDTDTRTILRILRETVSHANAMAHNVVRALLNAASHLDANVRSLARPKVESSSHADAIPARAVARLPTSAVAHADAVSKNEVRAARGSVSHADALARTEARALAQAASHADAQTRTAARRSAQSASHADATVRVLARTLRESQINTDADVRTFLKILKESVGHGDTLARTLGRRKAEVVTLAEQPLVRLLSRISLSAVTHLEIAAVRQLARRQAQAVVTSDADARTVLQILLQAISHSDSVARTKTMTTKEAQAHVDALARALARAKADLHIDSDALVRTLARAVKEAVTHEDHFTADQLAVDSARILSTFDDLLWFMNMWAPRIYGPLIQDAIDAVKRDTRSG